MERDCQVESFRSGGPGGQHRNKRMTGIRLTHEPTGLTVTATERRSRTRNLDVAFERMAERLEEMQRVPRRRRRRRRPSRAARERRLRAKRHRGTKKALRRKPEV